MTADQKTASSQAILQSASPELIEALQSTMRNASTLLQIPALLLSLLDATGTPLTTFPTEANFSHLTTAGAVLSCPRDALIINDLGRDPRFNNSGNTATGSLLCVSLIEQEQPIGTLMAYSPQINAFNQQHLHMLTFVADQAALVIGMSLQAEKEAIQARTKILSTVTHELRSPINTINGYLDLALSGAAGELNPELREFVQRARSGSETLFAMLEDALLISRGDAGQLRLSRELIDLQDVITDAVEEMELTARDYEIAVAVEIDEELPLFNADAARLQQVVRNLLSNALHFTPSGGQITVMARTNCSDKDATEEPHFVKLQVKDTGCGIAPALHQRIFERFFQISGSQLQGRKGQGLGLTTAKMIVELHGGAIAVASEPGHGCSFLCILPVS